MLVLIKGAGDLATGVAHRLKRCGFDVVMTEIEEPTTVRRTVAFSQAVYDSKSDLFPLHHDGNSCSQILNPLHHGRKSLPFSLGPKSPVDTGKIHGALPTKIQIDHSRSSRCGAETNPTRNHELAGSIPGLVQWVKNPALP